MDLQVLETTNLTSSKPSAWDVLVGSLYYWQNIYSALILENAKLKVVRTDLLKVIIVYNLAREIVNPGI